jgi:acetoin utilization protein AcuC
MPLGIMYRPELKEYDFGPGHPFRGDRYDVFPGFLRKNISEDENYRFIETSAATYDDLLLICDKEYIDVTSAYFRAAYLGLTFPGNFYEFQSGDNQPIGTPGKVEEAARLVIGQAKTACDLVQTGKYQKVVSVGGGLHHAKRRFGEGFCLYNDVAFCGLYLKQNYHLNRVLILDTDAHAGNGTSEYFYEDPEVLFIDIHQDPRSIYPGTGFIHQIGERAGKGFTINIPLPEHSGEKSYRLAFEAVIGPVVREFKPQIIIRNGGSDPHINDGLTNLGLTIDGFRMIGEKTRQLSEICGGKVIDLLASGYNRTVLPYGWLALLTGLAGFECEISEPEPLPEEVIPDRFYYQMEKIIEQLRTTLKDYWACFR